MMYYREILRLRSLGHRQRKGDWNESIKQRTNTSILKDNDVITAEDIDNVLKEMFGSFLQEALEAELDTELGYPQNGQSLKAWATGAMAIPRNRCVLTEARSS